MAGVFISLNEYEKLTDDIERMREALQNIASKNPFHNQCPPINDVQFYSQVIVEMVGIANAALEGKE